MKIWDKNNWELLAVLLYCFVLAYFAPAGFSRIGFLPLLWFAYRSNNNALWLILLLVFIDSPAYFFYGGERSAVGRTPIYPLPGGGMGFNELLAFTLIFKSFKYKGTINTYRRGLPVLVILLVTVFFLSFAYTFAAKSTIGYARRITMWIFLFSIPRLMNSKDDWLVFFKLLFPFIFLIFADQLQVFITGRPLAAFFNADIAIYRAMKEVIVGGDQVSRAISGGVIIFIVFSSALIIYLNEDLKKYFKASYLFLIIFIAYIVILLSATRGWFIAFTFIFIASALVAGGKQLVRRIAPYFIFLVIAFSILLNLMPILQTQASNAWDRIMTLEQVAGGDLTAGGTVGRWTEVAPELLGYVAESPLGYGFSAEGYNLENEHAGIVNPMITLGVLGYIIVLVFVFGFMIKLFIRSQRVPNNNPYKNSLLVAVFAFMGLFAVHLTSRQIFGLNQNVQFNFLVPVIFSIGNWLFIESAKYSSSYPVVHSNISRSEDNLKVIETTNL